MNRVKWICAAIVLTAFIPGYCYAWPWSWDMFDQPSVKAQESKALAVPEGIVPVEAEPFVKDRVQAGKLRNPSAADAASIERGKHKFNIHCATCHGDGGKGDGLVGQKYVTPTDLTGDYVQAKPDGDIYFTIKNGGLGIMPSYGDAVTPADRWHIVNYIKHAFGKKGGAGVK